MSKSANQKKTILFGAFLILPLLLLFAISKGVVDIPFNWVVGRFSGMDVQPNSNFDAIVFSIRIPRALLAALIGALLGISGAVMQGMFRNPLADPSLIGVTAGASLGASLVIVLSANSDLFDLNTSFLLAFSYVTFGAFIGSLLAVLLVYRLSTQGNETSVTTMLLVGIAITSLVGGIGGLLELVSDNSTLRQMSLWRMGGLQGASYTNLLVVTIVAFCVLIALMIKADALNMLLLGESEARYLGVEVNSLKQYLIFWVAIAVGVSVAVAGPIAFVGLVVPHIIRLLLGPDHRFLLQGSFIGGAIILVLADTLARILLAPIELPLGLLTIFLGVPFFIFLLLKQKSYSF